MDMINVLLKAERDLPALLQDAAGWQGIFIDYEKPNVARLWRSWREYRINLHVIYPCEDNEAFFHPHSWPSAMKLLSGTYEMVVGFGSSLTPPPEETRLSFLLSAGSYYAMPHPDQWHSVRPLLTQSQSVMLTGPRWDRAVLPVTKKPETLFPFLGQEMLAIFRLYYPKKISKK